MFNILTDQWIPVTRDSASAEKISITQLSGCEYSDFAWDRADFRIATYELLIGLLTVIVAPRQTSDWHRRFKNPPSPDELAELAAPYADCFNLEGDGPRFLQDHEEIEGEPNAPQGLLIDAPGGNTVRKNADFFVRDCGGQPFSRAGAAIALYSLQAFAPSGGVGHRTSMRGGGPMTTLVVPRDRNGEYRLWQKLWAHVPILQQRYFPVQDEQEWHRMFPWLAPTRVSNKGQIVAPEDTTDPVHGLQTYFGMPRRIRLHFAPNEARQPCPLTGEVDDVVVTGYVTRNYGVNYAKWVHPLTPYYEQKKNGEKLPIHPKAGPLCYRDWLGIAFSANNMGGGASRTIADAVHNYRGRFVPGAFDILVAGYAMNNASVREFTETRVPFFQVGSEQDNNKLDALAVKLVDGALHVEARLRTELANARGGDKSEGVVASFAETFWQDTELVFRELIGEASQASESPNDKRLRRRWLAHLIETAVALFDRACPPERLLSMNDARVADQIAARRRLVYLAHRQGLAQAPRPAGTANPQAQEGRPAVTDAAKQKRSPSKAELAASWWRRLAGRKADGSPDPFGADPSALAHLRRCSSPVEAATEPAFIDLFRTLYGAAKPSTEQVERVAVVAILLAHLRSEPQPGMSLPRQLGRPRDAGGDVRLLSPARMRALIEARNATDVLRGFRNIIAILGRDQVPPADLAKYAFYWLDTKHGQKKQIEFLFDYHQAADAVPHDRQTEQDT